MFLQREKTFGLSPSSPEWIWGSIVLGTSASWGVAVETSLKAIGEDIPVLCWGKVTAGASGFEFSSLPEVYRDIQDLIETKKTPKTLFKLATVLGVLFSVWYLGKAAAKFSKKLRGPRRDNRNQRGNQA